MPPYSLYLKRRINKLKNNKLYKTHETTKRAESIDDYFLLPEIYNFLKTSIASRSLAQMSNARVLSNSF